MKIIFPDTNIFLRFFLNDVKGQAEKAEEIFILARAKKIKLKVLSIVLFELFFALAKVYKFSPDVTYRHLKLVLNADYLEVEDQPALLEAIKVCEEKKSGLIDSYLFVKAKESGGEVFSFDQDFKKFGVLTG